MLTFKLFEMNMAHTAIFNRSHLCSKSGIVMTAGQNTYLIELRPFAAASKEGPATPSQLKRAVSESELQLRTTIAQISQVAKYSM